MYKKRKDAKGKTALVGRGNLSEAGHVLSGLVELAVAMHHPAIAEGLCSGLVILAILVVAQGPAIVAVDGTTGTARAGAATLARDFQGRRRPQATSGSL